MEDVLFLWGVLIEIELPGKSMLESLRILFNLGGGTDTVVLYWKDQA